MIKINVMKNLVQIVISFSLVTALPTSFLQSDQEVTKQQADEAFSAALEPIYNGLKKSTEEMKKVLDEIFVDPPQVPDLPDGYIELPNVKECKTQMWVNNRISYGNCEDFTGETCSEIKLERVRPAFYIGFIPAETTHIGFYLHSGRIPSHINMLGSHPWYRDGFNGYHQTKCTDQIEKWDGSSPSGWIICPVQVDEDDRQVKSDQDKFAIVQDDINARENFELGLSWYLRTESKFVFNVKFLKES